MTRKWWQFSLATLLLWTVWAGFVMHLSSIPYDYENNKWATSETEIQESYYADKDYDPELDGPPEIDYGWPFRFIYKDFNGGFCLTGIEVGTTMIDVFALTVNLFCWLFVMLLVHLSIDHVLPWMASRFRIALAK